MALSKKRGPVAMANEIQRVRTIFKFAVDAELIDRPVRFGTAFTKPSRKRMRQARQVIGGRTFDSAELTKISAQTTPTMKAMVLLGINCGFGQADVASLPNRRHRPLGVKYTERIDDHRLLAVVDLVHSSTRRNWLFLA